MWDVIRLQTIIISRGGEKVSLLMKHELQGVFHVIWCCKRYDIHINNNVGICDMTLKKSLIKNSQLYYTCKIITI